MSFLRAVLFASPIVAGCVVIACKSSSVERPADLLDCDWAQSEANCWKPFVASIDKCLGHPEAGTFAEGGPGIGLLSADRSSCVYDGGPTVIGSQRLDWPQDAADDAPRAFTVQLPSGQVCVRYDQTPGKGNVTGPDGALSWNNDGVTLTITCPDGTIVRGANQTLLDCLEPGQLPGYAYYNTSESAFFQLLGMTGPVYSCTTDAGDAAVDSDAD